MSDRPSFEEVIGMIKDARSNLSHGKSYHELGEPLYEVATASIDGLLETLEALNKIERGI